MHPLATIHRTQGLNITGKTFYRHAVRAVILRSQELLMVHSSKVGDYKFPGGGVDEGESHEQALIREVQEECGLPLVQVGEEICRVVEFDSAMEQDYDVFKMTSYYYRCEVGGSFGMQKLDGYEQDLGFLPVWLSLERALQINTSLLDLPQSPEWLRREILVLEHLREHLLQ